MKTCRSCGTEIGDEASFCHICGASDTPLEDSKAVSKPSQQVRMQKNVFYVLMVALAVMGLVIVGLAVRPPVTVTQTTYVTQTEFATVSITSSATMTAISANTITVASFSTLSYGPPPSWFNQQYCGYPFNPYLCNEGPPVTIAGYLTNDTSCVNLEVATGQSYVVWNLPKTYPTGAYQIYGFIYPNWPSTQPFPPYPFQKTICVGTPMWAIPPYIQSA
jgi:hypothetical protein